MPRTLEQRLAFLDLHPDELELLRSLHPVIEANSDRIVGVFYRHLLSFTETRRLLADPVVKDRLLQQQKQYLISLVPPALGPEYVDDRLRIGRTHHRVGLEPRWYLGAYSLYFRLIVPLISGHFRGQAQTSERAMLALNKILMLDAQLAMESYIDHREEQLEYLNRELSRLSAQLERRYEEQTETLRETSARAEVAEELASIATIAAGLAHEIGTPMGVIRGHAEMLESHVESDTGRMRLRIIQEQIDRIAGIMRSLLDMASPHPQSSARLDLRRVLEDSTGFLAEKFRRREIALKLDAPAAVFVEGDASKLQQIFLNLFLNAVDAMPDGGELHISLGQRGDTAEIRVADTGRGIEPEILSRIFEPFFTTKEAGRGHGLGLMVTKTILRDHGGRIEASSRIGEGTEFRIELPLARGTAHSLD
jgi:signal transduction histidine kinase